ncbi:hypothetical protein BDC45DRAFT_529682 [Circinella umbellata]|nr:hypothetical protein BDC45DRAFT_529682 [Circinella umbellata]
MSKGKSRIPVRSRGLKSDEKWCIDEGDKLSFEIYANHFKCLNKQKTHNRYMEILNNMNNKDSLRQHEFWLDKALVKEQLKSKKKVIKVVDSLVSSVVNEMKTNLGKRKAKDESSQEDHDNISPCYTL